jgi:urease accessory protein
MTVPIHPSRARGALRARIEYSGGPTFLARLFETGGLRMRCPRAPTFEGVMINSAGGVVGGDGAIYDFEIAANAEATLTTQSAEKIYRSDGATARVDISLRVGAGAKLDWIPQETILFDQARLSRRLSVDLAVDSRFLLVESLVFGRLAMGEQAAKGFFRDSWRIRRDGKLVFAEEMRIGPEISATLDRPACGAGARACATLLMVAPDAERQLDGLRSVLDAQGCVGGVSAWDAMLAARLASPSPDALRKAVAAALAHLRGCDLPRVWQ